MRERRGPFFKSYILRDTRKNYFISFSKFLFLFQARRIAQNQLLMPIRSYNNLKVTISYWSQSLLWLSFMQSTEGSHGEPFVLQRHSLKGMEFAIVVSVVYEVKE